MDLIFIVVSFFFFFLFVGSLSNTIRIRNANKFTQQYKKLLCSSWPPARSQLKIGGKTSLLLYSQESLCLLPSTRRRKKKKNQNYLQSKFVAPYRTILIWLLSFNLKKKKKMCMEYAKSFLFTYSNFNGCCALSVSHHWFQSTQFGIYGFWQITFQRSAFKLLRRSP